MWGAVRKLRRPPDDGGCDPGIPTDGIAWLFSELVGNNSTGLIKTLVVAP